MSLVFNRDIRLMDQMKHNLKVPLTTLSCSYVTTSINKQYECGFPSGPTLMVYWHRPATLHIYAKK